MLMHLRSSVDVDRGLSLKNIFASSGNNGRARIPFEVGGHLKPRDSDQEAISSARG